MCVLSETLASKVPLLPVDVSLLWNNFPEPSKKGDGSCSEEFLTHSGNTLQASERKQTPTILRKTNGAGRNHLVL